MQRKCILLAIALLVAACAPRRAQVAFDMRAAPASMPDSRLADASAAESYARVPARAAAILGCDVAPESPICVVALPTAEEDSAFRAEGERLASHADPRCRLLAEAIAANESAVRMYPRALIRRSGPDRLYGVGHTYTLENAWLVRVARRIDDLNERTLDEKKRTLRHEMSHTIGATETRGRGWVAEDYAAGCS